MIVQGPQNPSSSAAPSLAASDAAPASASPLLALGRALATHGGCLEPENLTASERAACEERLPRAPAVRLAESNPYAIVGEHVAIMGAVRHRENSQRFGCELMRNLDSTCPNALPNNKPEDYERPKPRPNKN